MVLGCLFGLGSEALSVRTNFPFGGYEYLSHATREVELWLFDVPVMASLSFIFLTYAGYMTSLLVFAPLSNFAGWLLVSFLIVLTFQAANRLLGTCRQVGEGLRNEPQYREAEAVQSLALPGLALHAGILAFNLAVTFAIGELRLALISTTIALGTLGLVLWRIGRRFSRPYTVSAHHPDTKLRDELLVRADHEPVK